MRYNRETLKGDSQRTPIVITTGAGGRYNSGGLIMTEEKRPFTGTVISGEPVTTQKAREAGIIKKSKVTEEPEEQPIKTDNDEQTEV